MSLGRFVLHCIDQRRPQESCLREARILFAEERELERYIADMYEIFIKE